MIIHRDAVPQTMTVSCHRNRENRESKPDRVQLVSEFLFSTLALNEIFQGIECLFVTCLDSLRIVENIASMIGEHKLVVDPVLASLDPC